MAVAVAPSAPWATWAPALSRASCRRPSCPSSAAISAAGWRRRPFRRRGAAACSCIDGLSRCTLTSMSREMADFDRGGHLSGAYGCPLLAPAPSPPGPCRASGGDFARRGEAVPAQSNRLETLCSLAMRPMASPISGAIEMRRIFLAALAASVALDGVGDHQFLELAAGDALGGAAGQHAVGDVGRDLLGAGLEQGLGGVDSVPPQSTMSSIRMQSRPATSPMMFITSVSPARGRRLSTMARSASRRWATARARTTPPTSGETIISVRGRRSARWMSRPSPARREVVGRDVEEALDLAGVQIHRQRRGRRRRR